ncbi:MAG: hypothetical protein JXA73_07675 [Acidobacteria bacterium]|nr:hypothetical protein [Acidobacteriota bacterium]
MKKTILIAAVMFLALSVSAFAQSAYTVSMETLDRVACCGLAELTGSIAFTAVADTPASITGTITLRYNVQIANTGTNTSGAERVRVSAVDDDGNLLSQQPPFVADNDGTNGRIVITVPAGYTYPNTINVYNVRVDVSAPAKCGTTTGAVSAVATATGNRLTIGETDAIDLVKGVAPAILAPSVASPIAIDATNGTYTGTGAILIRENFYTAFGTTGVFPVTTANQQTLVRLKISPIPADLAIRFPITAGNFRLSDSAGTTAAIPATLTTNVNPQYLYYVMAAASNPGAQDSFTVTPELVTVDAPFPKAPATITVSASMAPLKATSPASLFPQFILDTCETSAATLATISGVMNTVLMVPFAPWEEDVFDTGIAIANTTLDPGTIALGGFQGAIQQVGKIKIYFYNNDGVAIAAYDSTAHPGEHGLDASGLLPAGRMFIAMLSELLPETVTGFSGYMIIVTDFTNAHGEYFISDWEAFTHGSLMLVVTGSNTSAGRTVEYGLDQ